MTDLLSLKLQLHLMLIVDGHPLPWLGTSGAHLTSALVFSQLGLPRTPWEVSEILMET